MSVHKQKSLLRDSRFWPIFWAQFLGALNDNFFKNALVILITYKSVNLAGLGPGSLVAAAGGIFIFPFFLCSATAGQIADRFEKSKVIRFTKVSEFVIMGLAAIGLLLNSFPLLFFVLFLMGAQSAFFGPLKYGSLPSLLKNDELCKANAFVSGGTFIAILIGTILGGQLAVGENPSFFICVGILLTAAIGFLFSMKVEKMGGGDKSINVDFTLFRPMKPVLRITKSDPKLFRAVMGVSWFWFLGAGILSLLPNYVKTVLGGTGEVATFFLAIFTIGMGIGAFLCERISKKKVELGLIPISALGMSIFLFGLWLAGTQWEKAGELMTLGEFFTCPLAILPILSLLLVSVFGGMFIIPQMTFLQTYSSPQKIARVIAGNNIWNAIFMVVGSLFIMGLYHFEVSIPSMFLILSGINIVVSFKFYSIYSEQALRLWGWVISHSFYKLNIEGQEHLPETGGFILASNHVSYVDWALLWAISPRPIRYVIDWRYYFVPMGPFWYGQAKLIPIATRKESPEILEKAYAGISQNLRDGHALGLFPEGHLCRDGKIRRFQPGIKKIITKDPVPVVPVVMKGLWGSFFSHEGRGVFKKMPNIFKRRNLTIKIGRPISAGNFDLKAFEEEFKALNGGVLYESK